MAQPQIQLPYGYEMYPFQIPVWEALDSGVKRASLWWHRRAGKDLNMLNYMWTRIVREPGLYWHMLPTYNQGRKVIWNGKTNDGRSFLSYIPPELIARKREDDMSIWTVPLNENGDTAIWQVVGGDQIDSLVGSNPRAIVFSEFALYQPRTWHLMRPILRRNNGIAVFVTTPRGRNHAYRLHQMALQNPLWFAQTLTVEDTGLVTPEEIEQERREGMPEELIQQEYYCSPDVALVGSYYSAQMAAAHREKRITKVPWDPMKPVYTAWDLGLGDSTAIWFAQQNGKMIDFIEYYRATGVGLEHYTKVLSERPYTYAEDLLPHDAAQRELGTGRSKEEMLRGLGRRCRVVTKLSIADGINAVRALLPLCRFDEEKCAPGIEALKSYVKEEDFQETDEDGRPLYKDHPKHNWASHGADAMRTFAVGYRPINERRAPLVRRVAIV